MSVPAPFGKPPMMVMGRFGQGGVVCASCARAAPASIAAARVRVRLRARRIGIPGNSAVFFAVSDRMPAWRRNRFPAPAPPARLGSMTQQPIIARGGKSIYGAPLGILMLEARFPRIPGDMGNATTWPFPVLYKVVPGATPERVVLQGARGLLPDFIEAAQELVQLGAEAITTNCGFLSLFQSELAGAVGVPVATSSLMQVRWVQATLPPGKIVGVVTVCGTTLTPAHLESVGVPLDTPVV